MSSGCETSYSRSACSNKTGREAGFAAVINEIVYEPAHLVTTNVAY